MLLANIKNALKLEEQLPYEYISDFLTNKKGFPQIQQPHIELSRAVFQVQS